MQCSKIEQIVFNPQTKKEQKGQLVIGISDYLPLSLKNNSSISIAIEGNYTTIIETILWSQFFTKTLLKECQHHLLLQSYTSQGITGNNPLFIKTMGKICKLDECLEWNSPIMLALLQQKVKKGDLSIEGFSQTGRVKTISIFFGINARNSHTDIILRLLPSAIRAEQIFRSNFQQEAGTFRTNELSHKAISINSKSQNTNPLVRCRTPIDLEKGDQMSFKFESLSNIGNSGKKCKTKPQTVKQSANKQNAKVEPQPPKLTKNRSVKSTASKPRISTPTNSIVSRQTMQETNFNVPQMSKTAKNFPFPQAPNNRESVLSKIVSSKDEQIIILKKQLKSQQARYEELLAHQKQEQIEQEEQEETITNNIKKVLEEYETKQKEQQNQNGYLKERVKILENALVKSQAKQEECLIEKESLLRARRQLEETIRQSSELHKGSKKQYESQIDSLRQENENKNADVKKWMQKCMMFQKKYDDLVGVMRLSLPKDD